MSCHTGNWTGKTVSNAFGSYIYNSTKYTVVDLPGTYSLLVSSAEEEQARNFLINEQSDTVVVVTDATCLERNLNLVLQILEITDNVIVCVNLLDEAKKKKIIIDLDELSLHLGVPVVGLCASKGKGTKEFMETVQEVTYHKRNYFPISIKYDDLIENCVDEISKKLESICNNKKMCRYYAMRLLEDDEYIKSLVMEHRDGKKIILDINDIIKSENINPEIIRDRIVESILEKCEYIYNKTVFIENSNYNSRDRKIDKFLTSPITGIPIIILLLAFIFWLTIIGANYPSQWLSSFFSWFGNILNSMFKYIHLPKVITSLIVDGIYKTTSWVVAVMLPPMAIFFPLFTLLEDFGYLPRIAFNLDGIFKKANCHGKQSLSMCMGFGCNACGVTGCRIIDSPRERLIAIITNSFIPCNGRFPALITLITIFFASNFIMPYSSIITVLVLLAVIILGIIMTFIVSKFLSATFLKGQSSSFALELPPYRKPQIGKIIIRSIFDRTLFVLGRAVAVAAPAGLIIWLLANIKINNLSIISYITDFINPFAQLFGMDGIILTAFILGFPANEIVIPIMIMLYSGNGILNDTENITTIYNLFTANGWTITTAICVIIFYLMHFPCSTTCISIYKETKSKKWTLLSFFIPLICGLTLCFIVNIISKFISLC